MVKIIECITYRDDDTLENTDRKIEISGRVVGSQNFNIRCRMKSISVLAISRQWDIVNQGHLHQSLNKSYPIGGRSVGSMLKLSYWEVLMWLKHRHILLVSQLVVRAA